MKIYQILGSFLALLILSGCGATSKPSSQFKELPEICRGYDFASDPEMADACGIRQTRYKSYKNLPLQRFLIYPKDAYIVLTKTGVELRLANTHPVDLDGDLDLVIDFSKEATLTKLKNKYIYKELYPKNEPRMRIFKMEIPTSKGERNFCFQLPQISSVDKRSRLRMGNTITHLECNEFDSLVSLHK